jgi:hypothetical protein
LIVWPGNSVGAAVGAVQVKPPAALIDGLVPAAKIQPSAPLSAIETPMPASVNCRRDARRDSRPRRRNQCIHDPLRPTHERANEHEQTKLHKITHASPGQA